MTTKYIAPLLAAARIESAAQVGDALAPIRDNRMAKAGIEAAVWDLEAKLLQTPLWKHIGGTQEEIVCGVSIGLQETTDALVEEVAREVESGYRRIKLKIKPGRDVHLLAAVRRSFPTIALSVDANSAYQFERDAPLFKQLDEYDLLMIEQPLAPKSAILPRFSFQRMSEKFRQCGDSFDLAFNRNRNFLIDFRNFKRLDVAKITPVISNAES